jgi:hypothetical protein
MITVEMRIRFVRRFEAPVLRHTVTPDGPRYLHPVM